MGGGVPSGVADQKLRPVCRWRSVLPISSCHVWSVAEEISPSMTKGILCDGAGVDSSASPLESRRCCGKKTGAKDNPPLRRGARRRRRRGFQKEADRRRRRGRSTVFEPALLPGLHFAAATYTLRIGEGGSRRLEQCFSPRWISIVLLTRISHKFL